MTLALILTPEMMYGSEAVPLPRVTPLVRVKPELLVIKIGPREVNEAFTRVPAINNTDTSKRHASS